MIQIRLRQYIMQRIRFLQTAALDFAEVLLNNPLLFLLIFIPYIPPSTLTLQSMIISL